MKKNHLTRREMLTQCSTGFGLLALQGLLAAPRPAHFGARAKHVILCYMSGGVSQVDTFDPKPALRQLHGKPMPVKVERTQFNRNGNVMASPFEFAQYGQSGVPISSIFPNVAESADELAVIRSLTSKVNEHAQGNYAFHTGFPFMGHPSAGAWMTYGLGTQNEDLPGFVVLQSGGASIPHGGVGLFSNGYLPAETQGSIIAADRTPAVRNIQRREAAEAQRSRLDFVKDLDGGFLKQIGGDNDVEAAVRNYETAYRMQTAVPELCDISNEPEFIRKLYGLDSRDRQQAGYGRQCLLARRLVESGVRFIELSCLNEGIGAGNGPNPWDQHGDLQRGHAAMAHQVDKGIGALLKDLRSRGLLDETIVIWAGEFGRTPFSQGRNGRDHNPFGYSMWLAGGGVKGGTVYGATDELGYHATEGKCDIYDLWATVLHLLGMDHEALTYRHGGRDLRLTDVHGSVIQEVVA